MNAFSALPRVSQLLISASAYVTGDQRIHGLCGHLCSGLASPRYLCNLSIKYTLFIGINLKSSQHIDFLNQKRRSILLSKFLSYGCKDAGRISVFVGLSVKLYSLHFLVLLDQMVCISL
jgi:hypothetical protein